MRIIPKLILPVLLSLLSLQCGDKDQASGPPPPMPVQVAKPVLQTVAPTETYTGRFSPIEEVDLQARVSGYLESVHFTEGQEITKGDLMFKIDPRVFDAALARAEARQKQSVARLGLAEGNLERAKRLVEKRAVSQEEFDNRDSEVAQAQADVMVAEADLQTAKLDRDFSEVYAPISGIAGSFQVTVGNFVSGGFSGGTILTTIVPHDPIYCNFEVDERRVLQFTRLFFEGDASGREGEQSNVEIAVSDSENFEFEGKINYTENQLDRSTATLQIRALVENPDKFLTPGLFARVKVAIGTPSEQLLVQDTALGFDQDKRFAWVLNDDNTVARTYVETGTLQNGLRVITSGIDADSKIAITGIQLLRPETVIAPQLVEMLAPESVQ